MKQIRVWATLMILLSLPAMIAADKAEFDEAVAFEETLKSLALSVRRGTNTVPEEKALVLDGIISGVRVIESEEDSFRARIELSGGEWSGLDEIRLYKAYVDVSGSDFFRRIPSRANRDPSDGVIEKNRRAVVVGNFEGQTIQEASGSETKGDPVPVLQGFYVRIIE